MRILEPLAACLLLAACATTEANRYYDAAVPVAPPTLALGAGVGAGHGESVSGLQPETVLLRTGTQSFCRGYQFDLVDGRIYYKRADANPRELWRPLTGTGLPHAASKGFRLPRRIVSISADADELYAISDEGVVYMLFVERDRKQRPFEWIDRLGWPDASPLVLNELVASARAWSIGTRDAGVLWYEDAAGSQHHYGTMGITTLYFLTANGQEIRFADTGLPSDFSHSLLGPERGAFVSVGLSASASTVFVIGDAGEMYTRLADFDTLGSDPMFFKYTYAKGRSEKPGADYGSNFTPWALPAEGWRRQPAIPLTGAAALSRHVSIHQTGRGNGARELRVAGLSPDGVPGYYHKAVFDASWRFTPGTLALDPADLLDRGRVASGRGSRGPRLEAAYAGALWQERERQPDLSFGIPDFSMREGSSTLEVSLGGERVGLELHTVDMWTYVKRFNPGLDGTPKLFHATVVIPPRALDAATPALRDRVRRIFGPLDGALFALKVEATDRYVLIESADGRIDLSGPLGLSGLLGRSRRFGLPGRPYLLLTSPGQESADVNVLRSLSAAGAKGFDGYLSEELMLPATEPVSAERQGDLRATIGRNERYRERLETGQKLFRSYGRSAELSRWGYSLFDVLTTFTLIDRIDFPKFRTMTSHGDDIIRANAGAYRFMASAKERVYAKVLELLAIRIAAYREVLEALEEGAPRASLPAGFRETHLGYLELVGLPPLSRGTSPAQGGRPATVQLLADSPLFPGLVLAIGPPEGGPAEVETVAVVVLDDLPGAARSWSAGARTAPFRVAGRLQGVLHRGNGEPQPLDDDRALLEWDGSTLTLWRDGGCRSRERLFFGQRAGP